MLRFIAELSACTGMVVVHTVGLHEGEARQKYEHVLGKYMRRLKLVMPLLQSANQVY